MSYTPYSISAGFQPDGNFYGIWIHVRIGEDNNRYLITEDGLEPHEPGMSKPATARLTKAQAEALMAQLWADGIRPPAANLEGQLVAMREHLEDVQATLDIERQRFDLLLSRTLNP
tara:strand:+ start:12107 stop:12454 length:348 start_codon:yes stop_codon:yes gene_type:complete